MEFFTISAPPSNFESFPEYRVQVDESGCYYPCGVPGLRGPYACLNEAAAAILKRHLRAQLRDASSTAVPDAAPEPAGSEDAGDLPLWCDKDAVAMSSEALKEPEGSPLESAQHTPLKEPLSGISSSSESTASDILPPSKRCRVSSHGSTSMIWVRILEGWAGTFHIRMDRSGLYYTYPYVGGPFPSLQEADAAINSLVCAQQTATLQDPATCERQPEESFNDWLVRRAMSSHGGRRRKKCSKSERIQNEENQQCQFVQVILDKYNADNNHLGDLAYEVKDVVHR